MTDAVDHPLIAEFQSALSSRVAHKTGASVAREAEARKALNDALMRASPVEAGSLQKTQRSDAAGTGAIKTKCHVCGESHYGDCSAPPKPAPDAMRMRADQAVTTRFDEVSCEQLTNCGWPECECPRKGKHSPEAVAAPAVGVTREAIKRILWMAISDGEYLGRHGAAMPPQEVIELRHKCIEQRADLFSPVPDATVSEKLKSQLEEDAWAGP